MAADTTSGGTPTVSPDTVSVAEPADVWFQYSLTNSGDEDDTTTGFYITVEDKSGTFINSDYAPDDTIPAGGTIEQGVKIDASIIGGLTPGDFWVSLRGPSGGDTLSAALLTVTD
jgi:hypothetical protein